MCNKLSDTIVIFNVSGTTIKIPSEKLALHPDSLLTTMVHNKIQPVDGFFVACCPKIFRCISNFVLRDIRVDPTLIARKIGATETQVRDVVDGFGFSNQIYIGVVSKNEDKSDVNIMDPRAPEEEQKASTKAEADEEQKASTKAEATRAYAEILTLALNGDLKKLKLIVDQGWNLDVRHPTYGNTALMNAVQNNCLDCVQLLIDHGADVNAVDNYGVTALHRAYTVDVVKALINGGANVNAIDSLKKWTPLELRLRTSQYKAVIRELLNNGADIHGRSGETLLHVLLRLSTDDELLMELISKEEDLYCATETNGDTFLHLASKRSLAVVKHLLRLGADPTVKNNDGEIPLIVAAKAGKDDIVAELCEHMVTHT
jgi:ankyrin repeat protein